MTISVYAAANVTAFTAANLFANWIDKSFEQSANKLNKDQKPFKDAMLNIVVVGGSLLIVNVIVSNMTHSPISKVTLLALSMTGAGARYLLQSPSPLFQTKDIIITINQFLTDLENEKWKTRELINKKIDQVDDKINHLTQYISSIKNEIKQLGNLNQQLTNEITDKNESFLKLNNEKDQLEKLNQQLTNEIKTLKEIHSNEKN
ncbi:MAG: hypothetical protein ACH350_10580 [Parachlamydiaceae bacterium]